MTLVLGVRCQDGIVLGADGRATLADSLGTNAHIATHKIEKVGPDVLVATAGSVGLRQRFCRKVTLNRDNGPFNENCTDRTVKIAAEVIESFKSSYISGEGGYDLAALMAAPFEGKHELVEFEDGNLQPEQKTSRVHFVSIGSGQRLADPFLGFLSRVLWGETEPTIAQAKIAILWALKHTSLLSPTAIGRPFRLGVLSKRGEEWTAETLDEEDFGEQTGHITQLEDGLPDYVRRIVESETLEPIPDDPTKPEDAADASPQTAPV